MKLHNPIFILLIILLSFILRGCFNTPIENKVRTDFPYIENGILYTETKSIPIKYIKRVDMNENVIRDIIITYEYDKYNGGMISMPYWKFKKIEQELLGRTYEEKLEEQKKN